MPEEGVEARSTVGFTGDRDDSRSSEPPRVDASARSVADTGPSVESAPPTVETALAHALSEAAIAARFDVVIQLARELEARRLAVAGNVIPLKRNRS